MVGVVGHDPVRYSGFANWHRKLLFQVLSKTFQESKINEQTLVVQHLVGSFRNGVFAFVSAFFEIHQQDILSRLDTSIAEYIYSTHKFDITDSDT